MLYTFLIFVAKKRFSGSNLLAWFRDKRSKDQDANTTNTEPSWEDKMRAVGRTFVLSVADTQIIFVGGFLLGFAGQGKCKLTSYHFTASVSQMMIALSAITFSVALVRTYWRNPLAAALRLVPSLGAFIGVGITIFREADYAPFDLYKPPEKDNAILLPVACLLEGTLRSAAEKQAQESDADLGFGAALNWFWPAPDRILFIVLGVTFLWAHFLGFVRFRESRKPRNQAIKERSCMRKSFSRLYLGSIILMPTGTSIFCWIRVYIMRKWVDESGWMESPNTEMIIWDSGGLIAMGIIITVLMNVLTEAFERKKKEATKEIEEGAAYKQLVSRDPSPMHMNDRGYNRGQNRPFNTSRLR